MYRIFLKIEYHIDEFGKLNAVKEWSFRGIQLCEKDSLFKIYP